MPTLRVGSIRQRVLFLVACEARTVAVLAESLDLTAAQIDTAVANLQQRGLVRHVYDHTPEGVLGATAEGLAALDG